MWVTRIAYLRSIEELGRLRATVQSNQGQIDRLQKEIDYWRGKFEEAQNRADRVTDLSLTTGGMTPVTDLGLKEAAEQSKKYDKMMKDAQRQMTEMFADEIPGMQEPLESLNVDPELLGALAGSLKSE